MALSTTISEQINNQYRDYAFYILEKRGIPNFYDGLTPVQRLVLENSPSNFNKTDFLVGNVMGTGLYHHGPMSLGKAIGKLARPFGCSEMILEGDGFFGTPIDPTPAAPRYTKVRISRHAKETISEHMDLNIKNYEGGHDWIHVEFPLGLLTHIVGIAIGYRSNILPRKKEDVLEYLEGQNKLLRPYFKDFSGKISRYGGDENSWLLESQSEVDMAKRTIRVFDLPPIMKYDTYINKITQKLDDSGINYNIENRSQDKCDIKIVLRGTTPTQFNEYKDVILKAAMMIVRENVILIRDGAVMEFSSVKEYLDHFKSHLEFVRLKRLEKDLDDFNMELEYLEAKLKFLIFMSDKKRKNTEIIAFLKKFKTWISKRLSQIQIVKLSSDHIQETKDLIAKIKRDIIDWKKKITKQKKILEQARKKIPKRNKSMSVIPASYEEQERIEIDGIEVFSPDEEDDIDIEYEDDDELDDEY